MDVSLDAGDVDAVRLPVGQVSLVRVDDEGFPQAAQVVADLQRSCVWGGRGRGAVQYREWDFVPARYTHHRAERWPCDLEQNSTPVLPSDSARLRRGAPYCLSSRNPISNSAHGEISGTAHNSEDTGCAVDYLTPASPLSRLCIF